jgi:nucleolar pre-ribosomal-associated protein 2
LYRLGLELENDVFQKMLQDVFWIASASIPENRAASTDWLLQNSEAFPGLWMSILHSEGVLNNKPLLGK